MKKRNIFLFTLIPFLLASCSSNQEVNEEDKAIADEVADCAAIAQLSRGCEGVQVMYSSPNTYNLILKPYQPSKEEMKNGVKPIYNHTLLLATWFALERDESIVANLSWSFSLPEYVEITPPINDKVPHETVSFVKYPEYGEEVKMTMTGVISYKSASSTVNYNIVIRNMINNA